MNQYTASKTQTDQHVSSFFSIEIDEYWMQRALCLADQAAQRGEVPVGALMIRQQQLISESFNLTLTHQDPTAHAELLVLRQAAQVLQNHRLPDCDLYVTLEPCAMCAGALLHARVRRVVFGCFDRKTGVAGGVLSLFDYASLNHQTHVRGGILHRKCAETISSFFQDLRNNQSKK